MKLSAILAPLVAAKADHETIMKVVLAFECQHEAEIEAEKEKARARWRKWKSKQTGTNVGKRLQTEANVGKRLARVEDITSNLEGTGKKIEPNGSLSETSSDAKPTKARKAYPPAFEAVWRDYPTDANMSKAEAFDAWKKLDAADKDALAASVGPFRDYCRANPEYRPIHMCRFIAKRRFDGFAAEAKPKEGNAEQWQKRLSYARQQSTWAKAEWGPPPGSPGCLVPPELLKPGDGDGWREWKQQAA